MPALCCECLLRAPNHDVAVVTMARAELSSHRVGIHKVSRMARAGCLFEGVMVTNVGCFSIGPGAEVTPSGVQGWECSNWDVSVVIAGSPTRVALE